MLSSGLCLVFQQTLENTHRCDLAMLVFHMDILKSSCAVSERCHVSYRMTYRPFFITSSSDSSRKNRLRRSLKGSVFCGAQISPFLPNLITPLWFTPLSWPPSLHHLQQHRDGKTSSDEEEPAHKHLSSLCPKEAIKRIIFKRFVWTDEAVSFNLTSLWLFSDFNHIALPHFVHQS